MHRIAASHRNERLWKHRDCLVVLDARRTNSRRRYLLVSFDGASLAEVSSLRAAKEAIDSWLASTGLLWSDDAVRRHVLNVCRH